MKKLFMLIGLMMVVLAAPVYADTVSYVNGTIYSTTALTGFSTTGAMMDGMTVTVGFADGSNQTVLWADTGFDSGAAAGTGWSLRESGDTYGGYWTLTNTGASSAITSLFINAATGDTLFDVLDSGYGTDGSALGWAFDRVSSNDFSVNATYSNAVGLNGNNPVGDLFLQLSLNFVNGTLGYREQMTFIADTDNLRYAGDIVPTPEPASMLLLGLGIIGLAGVRRKIQK